MQYEVAQVSSALDLPRFESLLIDVDPAAMVDLEPVSAVVRLSTSLDARAVLNLLGMAGADTQTTVIYTMPSTCCGGCSG